MVVAPEPPAPVDLDRLDLTDREIYRQGFPHRTFETLRAEAPVWWHPAVDGSADGEGFWVLSRHADIQAISRDRELFTAADGPALDTGGKSGAPMLTNLDGEAHLRLRKLISAGFTPRMIARLEEQARGWAVKILDDALERGSVNFVEDVAYQLPMHMIADIMGIPVEDRPYIFQVANDMMQCTDPEHEVPASERPRLQREIIEYGQALSAAKRRHPDDDVWSLLTQVKMDTGTGETGLSELELDGFFILLTIGGSETTRNAISLGLCALLDDPEQLALLRGDSSLLKTATEEIVRWSSPVSYFRRTVVRDTELRGTAIAAGDRVTIWYPSGNRDEAAFEDPFRFDVRRQQNEQVSFGGGGAHFCLGAHLARREIMILFEELLARVGEIERLGEPSYSVQGISNPIITSLKDLPVELAAGP